MAAARPADRVAPRRAAPATAGVLPVPEADGATLSEGGGPSCTIALPQLGAGDTHLYQFGVVPGSEMSLIVVLRARGGTAVM